LLLGLRRHRTRCGDGAKWIGQPGTLCRGGGVRWLSPEGLLVAVKGSIAVLPVLNPSGGWGDLRNPIREPAGRLRSLPMAQHGATVAACHDEVKKSGEFRA